MKHLIKNKNGGGKNIMTKKKEKKIDVKKKDRKADTKKPMPSVWDPSTIYDAMERNFWDDPWTPFWGRRRGTLIPREFLRGNYPTEFKHSNVDLIDNGKEYKVVAELPGVNKNDVDISLSDTNINICGETKTETDEENDDYVRRERSYSTLCRRMNFPEEVNPDKAEATLKDGILEITIAKKHPSSGRKNIKVK
jgi:HSP20 family protein